MCIFIIFIGLFPVCVEVDADVINPKSTPLTDVSVYGFVKDDDAGEIRCIDIDIS